MWQCLILWMGLDLGHVAMAGPFGDKDPVEAVQEGLGRDKTAEEIAEEERLQAFEDAQRGKLSRVVVLQWKGSDTDYTNESLQRNIRNRTSRPDAKFYPEIDLYQAGRKERDRSVRHTDQRATVPESVVPRIMAAVDDVSQIPYSALREEEWGQRANELLKLGDEIWFLDRQDLRVPLFLLYAWTGYAAENTNTGSPPFYENVGGRTVNYFWYLAGALAFQDSSLMSNLGGNEDLYTSIQYIKDELERGAFPMLNLSFDDRDGDFDGAQFAKDFEVFVNGGPVVIENVDGILEVPLGRFDVYLKRSDGHGLSERVDLDRLTERFYFVRQNAWKTMGLDFQDQLMDHPYECTPPLDGDILTYLSIYAKLHPLAEIYIAVPKGGSTAPGRIFLWRWERSTGQLVLVQDNTGGFPVRFVGIASAGLAFSSLTVDVGDADLEGAVIDQDPAILVPDFAPVVDGVPLDWQLRGHYNRLLVGVGVQFKVGTAGETSFVDKYQTDGLLVVDGEAEGLRQRSIQRLVYATIGAVMFRDAAIGFGPRGYLRVGWTNVPHAVDMTAHVGLTSRLGPEPSDDEQRGRVRPIIDFDAFAGALIPYPDSLFVERNGLFSVGTPAATFGFTAGLGTTF